MTLNEMASSIRNNLGNGRKETPNHAYSLAQIRDAIGAERNNIILKESQKGTLNLAYFTQKFDNLKLEPVSFPIGGHSNTYGQVLAIRVPKLAMVNSGTAIEYIGPADLSRHFKVYNDFTFAQHKYSRVTRKLPFVYADLGHETDGYINVYFFNMQNTGLQYVSIRAVFADPVGILDADGYLGEDEEFPAPSSVQRQIINTITNDWVMWYKRLNHPQEPNTQTDIN